jgi:TolB protein
MLSWTREGAILFSRKLPGSKVPWEYQPQRPDTDHFNRDFKPESARGGTEVCRIDPAGGAIRSLTGSRPPVWDLRAGESPDGRTIVFCRAKTGRMPEIWCMESNGNNARRLTRGLQGRGADHPRWLPLREDG